jgi:hypothetical protein
MPRYLIYTYQTTRRHIPQERDINSHHLVALYLMQIYLLFCMNVQQWHQGNKFLTYNGKR